MAAGRRRFRSLADCCEWMLGERGRLGTRLVQLLYLGLTFVVFVPFLLRHFADGPGGPGQTLRPRPRAEHADALRRPLAPAPPTLRPNVSVAASTSSDLMEKFEQLKKSFSSFDFRGTGKSPAHHILDLCDPSAAAEAPRPAIHDPHRLKLGQLNTYFGFRQALQLEWFSHWMTTNGEKFDVLSFNELVNWDAEKLAERAAAWGYPHSAFLKTNSGFHLGIISRRGLPMKVLGKHTGKPLAHGALHVEVTDERWTHASRAFSGRTVRFVVTHLSPFDAHTRETEAIHISLIASGALLPGQNPRMSGPRHLWIKGWGPKTAKGPRLRNHRARVLLPSSGRTSLDSILRLAAGKHGMRRDAPSEVCAVFDGEYWGDLLTAKAEDYAATVDIGSLLYGYQFKDKDPDGSRAEHLVDPNFFPQVEIFYTRDACSDLSSRFPRAIPRPRFDNHSATPTFIMGDMNSLSPGDDALCCLWTGSTRGSIAIQSRGAQGC